jgi:hypothetical protein
MGAGCKSAFRPCIFFVYRPPNNIFIHGLLTLPPGYSFHRYDHWFHLQERNKQKQPEINVMQNEGVML